MKIVGCDLQTRYQQIAMLDEETGELIERRLEHARGEVKEFYSQLAGPVRVGIEATGHTRWFEHLLAELGHELWVGDAARIRASGGPQTEDRRAGCGAAAGTADERAVSPAVEAFNTGARLAPPVVASAEAGVDA